MYHGTCVTHMPWCMSGSLIRGAGENVSGILGACATRNLTSGKRPMQYVPRTAHCPRLSYFVPYPSGRSLEVGRGQRHTFTALPGNCTLQTGLRLHCVWHSIEYQFTPTGQHSQLWIETGIGSILYQPNLQPIHRGQWNSFGGTSVEAIHALLSENSCPRWQPSISCLAWIWPNH